jgi:hypothetical protein
MNIGVLTRLEVLSGSPEELVNQARNNIRLSPQRGHAESAFYISTTSLQEIYVFSLWLFDYQLDDIQQSVQDMIFRTLDERVKIINQRIFKLSWDYRLMPYVPVASNLRMMIFPKTFSQKQINSIMDGLRERRKTLSGVIGAWAGREINDRLVNLYRIDWINEQVQHEFLNSEESREGLLSLELAGVKSEAGSFSSQAIVQLDSSLTNWN